MLKKKRLQSITNSQHIRGEAEQVVPFLQSLSVQTPAPLETV